jgi:hypothetical protein
MGRFSEFSLDELIWLHDSLWQNNYNDNSFGIIYELSQEIKLRKSPAYKDEQLIRNHLKKHKVSNYEISADYEEAGIPVFVVTIENKVFDSYDNYHYFVYKGGIYSCRSIKAVEDFLNDKLGKEKKHEG